MAGKSQAVIESSYEKDFRDLVRKNCTVLKSIPVNCTDITNEKYIFDPDLSGVQEKNVRQKPVRVETEETYVPQYFMECTNSQL